MVNQKMRPTLSRRLPSRSDCGGPCWRGIGIIEVDAYMPEAGIESGAFLVVNFERRHVTAGGQYLVLVEGVPELLRFRRFPRSLRMWIASQWVAMAPSDLRSMQVVGRLVGITHFVTLQ